MSERDTTERRGVSSVIGVVLVVAITVVVATVTGGYLVGFGQGVESGVQAGATVNSDVDDNRITVSYNSAQDDATELQVEVSGPATDSTTLSSVGDTYSNTFASDGSYRVVVTAVEGDRRTVVLEEDVDV